MTKTLHSLRGRKVVERVRRRGKRWRGKHMNVTYVMEKGERGKGKGELIVGTYASSKLHKSAVKRNRMRRRCREAVRVTLKAKSYQLKADIQLLISPRSSSLTCDFAELREDAESLLSHLSKATAHSSSLSDLGVED